LRFCAKPLYTLALGFERGCVGRVNFFLRALGSSSIFFLDLFYDFVGARPEVGDRWIALRVDLVVADKQLPVLGSNDGQGLPSRNDDSPVRQRNI
jgi:hypothetical protein